MYEVGFVTDETYPGLLAHQAFVKRISELVTSPEAVAAGCDWEVLRYDESEYRRLFLRGSGMTREEEIFVALDTQENTSADVYCLGIYGALGFLESIETAGGQPGSQLVISPAHNTRIDYWVVFNGQRIAGAMKVGTPVYTSFYVGKINPYCLPHQWPYPLAVVGMTDSVVRFSDTTQTMGYGGYTFTGSLKNIKLYTPGMGWLFTGTPSGSRIYTTPFNMNLTSSGVRDAGGVYSLFPVEVCPYYSNSYQGGAWGAFDGVYAVSGFNNAVENTLTIDGTDYVVIQNVFRTGMDSYYAMRLD